MTRSRPSSRVSARRTVPGKRGAAAWRFGPLWLVLAATAARAGGLPADAPLPPPRPPDAIVVPLPPPRPAQTAPPLLSVPAAPASAPLPAFLGVPSPSLSSVGAALGPAPAAPAPDIACERLLSSGTVSAERLPAITGEGACGIAQPIKLAAIVDKAGRKVAVEPPIILRCDLAEALAAWVREDVGPGLAQAGRTLQALAGAGAYACRNRDRVPDAPLSQHAIGNAVDFGALRIDGHDVPVRTLDRTAPGPALKATACARFTTVLGPGSDSFHAEHLHLDLEPRKKGSQFCQWTLP